MWLILEVLRYFAAADGQQDAGGDVTESVDGSATAHLPTNRGPLQHVMGIYR